MRALVFLVVSAFIATGPLALAETEPTVPVRTESTEAPATSGSSVEAAQPAAQGNAVESPKQDTASELPTCVPK